MPLHPAAFDAARRVANGRETGPLLITSRGTRMARQYTQRIVMYVGARIGLGDITPRDLRLGFVKLVVGAGASMHDARRAARYVEGRRHTRYDRVPERLDPHPSQRLIDALLAK